MPHSEILVLFRPSPPLSPYLNGSVRYMTVIYYVIYSAPYITAVIVIYFSITIKYPP
jgi:hypothetical protein